MRRPAWRSATETWGQHRGLRASQHGHPRAMQSMNGKQDGDSAKLAAALVPAHRSQRDSAPPAPTPSATFERWIPTIRTGSLSSSRRVTTTRPSRSGATSRQLRSANLAARLTHTDVCGARSSRRLNRPARTTRAQGADGVLGSGRRPGVQQRNGVSRRFRYCAYGRNALAIGHPDRALPSTGWHTHPL